MTAAPPPSTPRPLPVRRPPAPAAAAATLTELAAGDRADWADRAAPDGPHASTATASVQGTLALDLHPLPRPAAPLPAPVTPELRLVGSPRAASRDVEAWAARFAQATVEVLGGDRPLSQLLRWTTARVYQDLDRRVRILGRTAAAPQRLQTVRPQVRSVHVCLPDDSVAEVSVHVRHGARSRALAARLERHQGRWRCVALQLG